MKRYSVFSRIFSPLFAILVLFVGVSHILLAFIIDAKSEIGALRYETMVWVSVAMSLGLLLCAAFYQSRSKLRFAVIAGVLNSIGIMLGCIVYKESEAERMLTIYVSSVASAVFFPVLYRFLRDIIRSTDPKKLCRIIYCVSGVVYAILIIAGAVTGRNVGGNTGSISFADVSLQLSGIQPAIAVLYCAVIYSDDRMTGMEQMLRIGLYIIFNALGMVAIGETGLLLVIVLVAGAMSYICNRSTGAFWTVFVILAVLAGLIVWAAYAAHASEEAHGFIAEKLSLLYEKLSVRMKLYYDPASADPFKEGYQQLKTADAICVGSIWGNDASVFVPNESTDYIFSMLILKLGVAFGAVTIILYFLLFADGVRIAARVTSRLESGITFGFVFLISIQSVIMCSACLGLIPMAGVPMSFLSRGGVNSVIVFAAVSWIINAESLAGRQMKEGDNYAW